MIATGPSLLTIGYSVAWTSCDRNDGVTLAEMEQANAVAMPYSRRNTDAEGNPMSMSINSPKRLRKDHELPHALAEWGWRYHHLGVPTDIPRPGEVYLPAFKVYVSGFETSPYGIEWMRFEPGSPIPLLIQSVPHLAFVVDDLDAALVGKEVLTPPNSPSAGVRVAMIVHDGAPVELMEFSHEA